MIYGAPLRDIRPAGLRTPAGPGEDMGVGHRGADVPVVEELLDGADVVAILQQLGGEGLPEGMARGGLGAPGAAARLLAPRWKKDSCRWWRQR